MDDETLLKIAKNGLMVAGHEMGPVGDHWPALNAIAAGLEEEFDAIERTQAEIGEIEFHLADIIRDLEEAAAKASPEGREKILAVARELWDNYYAALEPVSSSNEPDAEDLIEEGMENYPHMKAASHILRTLGGRS